MSGKVNFFGLNAFGNPTGINPAWGAGLGGVAATGAAIGFRALTGPDKAKWGAAVGAGTGLLTAIGLWIPRKTRAAAWGALFAGAVPQAMLWAEQALMSPQKAADAAAAAASSAATNGIRGMELTRTPQLGMASMNNVPQLNGASAPSLSNPAAAQMAGMVPGVNGLAKHFGATLWG